MTTSTLPLTRADFLIDPSVVFLNHGSYGACPRPVFETYRQWQRDLEGQPVEFMARRLDSLLDHARVQVALYLNAPVEDLVFVPNATSGVNIAARSIRLQPGDEVLTTDHEYGACDKTWDYRCRLAGAHYRHQAIPLPLTNDEAFVEALWAGVTDRTRVIYLSHISSPTALLFPVAAVCARARAAGIITVIDGAHAPGHTAVDLLAIGADFYTGNFHKWVCAPKGSAFLYVRPEWHHQIEPLIISWGFAEDAGLVSRCQQQGTDDYSAYLTVPAALAFQEQHNWEAVRAHCRAQIVALRDRVLPLLGEEPIAPPAFLGQMFTTFLPAGDPVIIKARLYDRFRVEALVWSWGGRPLLRISWQVYNTAADADALIEALGALMNEGWV